MSPLNLYIFSDPVLQSTYTRAYSLILHKFNIEFLSSILLQVWKWEGSEETGRRVGEGTEGRRIGGGVGEREEGKRNRKRTERGVI
jgi:hypothetical protein